MERLTNEFVVNRSLEDAWSIICDLERIAPCMPGAQLEEIEGSVHRGRVKVKLGAISVQFAGSATLVERDDIAHVARLNAKGRDLGGKGTAEAVIVARAEAVDATHTSCVITTELSISGKVAQFGRGVMGEVSKRLVDEFAVNLNALLDERPSVDEPPDSPPLALCARTDSTARHLVPVLTILAALAGLAFIMHQHSKPFLRTHVVARRMTAGA